MADIIKHIFTRIDSSANWKTLNPVPRNGEQCIEVLNGGLFKLKIGDGVTPWVALNYYTTTGSGGSSSNINQTILSITDKYPLKEGQYYDLQTAIQALRYEDINLGMVIMFESSEDVWETWQLNSSQKSVYQQIDYWERLSQGINYIIFNNTEEGEIENGGIITNISVEGSEETQDYYQLMTLVYTAKDVITGNNKTDRIIIRSSEKSIIGVWDAENQILDINVSPDFIKDIEDQLDALNSLKQNRPNSATVGNIATFDANKDTVDSGKKFTTSVGSAGTDENIPTEKAVRSAINNALTSAVNYKGMCIESELPQQGEKVGDFWSISDFNQTAPGRNGRAIWNGGNPESDPPVAAHWDKEIDEFFAPDDVTITLNDSGALAIKNITQTDTTNSTTPGYSGTFTTIDSVTRNSYGQVTGINTKTVTMPSLGNTSTTAAQGDLAEYIANKTSSIRDSSTADNTKYPTELAVRTELDTKANKLNIIASQNYSLVNYNSEGIVISGTDIIDGGTF